ncbi:hypothetical protein M406DRAFT_75782 [Cryphonectria parasitica EP155]|uniref:Uncharacterized protein n=1 Tax=Cryphonectria parasitica (strain ATCC 38755 / EP155) TaxID=660469 RepID=A0A9P4Y977_CRYP1|nr:uncharacterized protein M406DRAFT_75782 [Cryphonectria parasitica EP155]KAF3769297.1 hypothetical protein M406DRAFT_75782 [Cryphonectria parasitica EP155]
MTFPSKISGIEEQVHLVMWPVSCRAVRPRERAGQKMDLLLCRVSRDAHVDLRRWQDAHYFRKERAVCAGALNADEGPRQLAGARACRDVPAGEQIESLCGREGCPCAFKGAIDTPDTDKGSI